MKSVILLSILLSLQFTSIAQKISDTTILLKVQKQAKFPGGEKEWHKYFLNKFLTLQSYKDWVITAPPGKKTKYSIKAKYIVSNLGKISDVVLESNLPDSLESEIKKIISESPDWIPAYQNRIAVNSYKKWSWGIIRKNKCE